MSTTTFLSPKQVAQGLNVSESSVKRWCDSGKLQAQYTEGGHRRIGKQALIQFIRSSNKTIVHPEILGLPRQREEAQVSSEQITTELCDNLLAMNEARCREIISELYLSDMAIVEILEQVIVPAMHLIGDRWECQQAEIYQERRGCELVGILVHELRRLIPAPPEDACVAIGGTVSNDPYRLASMMVETVLREAGWNATSLGENLPFETYARAIEQFRPKIMWLSLSYIEDEEKFVKDYQEFFQEYGDRVAVILGGQALHPDLLKQLKYFAYCENFSRLAAMSQTLKKIIPSAEKNGTVTAGSHNS